MPKYVTDPEVEVIGVGMLMWFQNMQSDEIVPLISPVMRDYGLESMADIDPEGWYPVSLSLDMFRVLDENPNTTSNMVSLGMSIVESLPMPPEVSTISDALHALNSVYDMALRNYPEYERYDIEQVSDRHVRLVDNSPYPHDMIYGYIYGLTRRYAPSGSSFVVERQYINASDPNMGGAVYDITW